jgi:glycosyltransferase involved in cell wall biosynthesis
MTVEARGGPEDGAMEPRATTDTLAVAINAQIDPSHAGGVESALRALIHHLAVSEGSERYVLLGTARFADALRPLAGRNQLVEPWPFPQRAKFRRMTPRWRGLHARAGALSPAVDVAHWGWWHARRATTRLPTPKETDAVLRGRGVEVVHFPYPTHFATELPYVYEPWDLQHRHHPDFFTAGERRWRDQTYWAGCEGAKLVITATRWTKADIAHQYGIGPHKIAVIPRGPSSSMPRPSAQVAARTLASYDIPDRFALYPAMSFPHKNHLRLFEALALLRDRYGISLPLVCTGRRYDPHWPVVQAAVERLGLQDQVRLLGPVPASVLAALYTRATMLVFPSLFEGLGLPVLEAMSYGLPVLAADATCLPEVAVDAALYFNGRDVEAIAGVLRRGLDEPELLAALRERAATVLDRFSWDRAAATFVACYRHAAGAPLDAAQAALLAEATA